MFHPNQFEVNEAWLVFQLTEVPIRAESDGDFHCIVLMDAASCFMLCETLVPAGEPEPSETAVRRMLEEAKAHKQELAKTLFIPIGQFTDILPAEAELQGMAVMRVPEDQLHVYISDARKAFQEYFGEGSVQ